MTRTSKDAILQAAAKALAWELFATAAYCRERAPVDLDLFERRLLSAAKTWRVTHENLERKRRMNDGKRKT